MTLSWLPLREIPHCSPGSQFRWGFLFPHDLVLENYFLGIRAGEPDLFPAQVTRTAFTICAVVNLPSAQDFSVTLTFVGSRTRVARRALLILLAVLLAAFLSFGVLFGPFPHPDNGMAVFVGMLGVAAMATQNALVRLAHAEGLAVSKSPNPPIERPIG
jgi:uncharacterized membrane protein YoaK (UPF0700 family)